MLLVVVLKTVDTKTDEGGGVLVMDLDEVLIGGAESEVIGESKLIEPEFRPFISWEA